MGRMSKTKNKNILVTGGGGYVGTGTVKHFLDQGHKVRILDLFVHGKEPLKELKNPKLDICQGDIRDGKTVADALMDITHVVHLAAIAGAPESTRIPELTWDINLRGTKNLVEQMKTANVDHLIFVSTCSNYGASGANKLMDEDATLDPISPYAESKVTAEKYLLDLADDIDFTICRLATVFGMSPRMRFDLLVNQFVRDAIFQKILEIYGEQNRTFVHVNDVAKAFDLIFSSSKKKTKGQVFNVGSVTDSNITKFELGKLIKKHFPETKVTLLDKVIDDRDYKVSFTKIESVLGFNPEYKIADGVKEIADFLESSKNIDPYSPKYSCLEKYLTI